MIELVADGGYDAVTVRRLAKLARVSTGTFYAQFGGKEECFVSTYAMAMEQIRQRVTDVRSSQRTPGEQLRLTVRRLLAALSADSKMAHVALVDGFDGGPAALERIRAQETELESAVRTTFERREHPPLSPAISTWITAGCLRIARACSLLDGGAKPERTTGELVEWGARYVEPAPDLAGSEGPPGREACVADLSALGAELGRGASGYGEERDLILAAALRLAMSNGYWGLSVPEIRAAAGLSRVKFSRHFRGVDDCYLAAIRTVAGRYAERMSAGKEAHPDWGARVCRDVFGLCAVLAANPTLAKLIFVDVLAAGAAGMRCREEMVGEFAAAWRTGAPAGKRPSQLAAEASMAAHWMAIAQLLESGAADRLPQEAATLSFILLAPVLGVADTVSLIESERRPGQAFSYEGLLMAGAN